MPENTKAEAIDPSFLKALLAEDEVGCVIRSHLYVEAQIDRYLELAVVDPKHLDDLDLSCAKKIELLCCLGFDTKFRGVLKRLARLRNDLAHDLSSSLTQQAVGDLYNALPKLGRQAVHASVGLLHQALGAAGPVAKYETLPVKLQFVLVVLNLERICYAACNLLRGPQYSSG